MIEKSVILPEGMPVTVSITADSEGQLSLGIRIDGGCPCVLDANLILPEPGKTKSYTKYVGDLV